MGAMASFCAVAAYSTSTKYYVQPNSLSSKSLRAMNNALAVLGGLSHPFLAYRNEGVQNEWAE
jgi:hypothetical protein